jgi:hypothetical protein
MANDPHKSGYVPTRRKAVNGVHTRPDGGAGAVGRWTRLAAMPTHDVTGEVAWCESNGMVDVKCSPGWPRGAHPAAGAGRSPQYFSGAGRRRSPFQVSWAVEHNPERTRSNYAACIAASAFALYASAPAVVAGSGSMCGQAGPQRFRFRS